MKIKLASCLFGLLISSFAVITVLAQETGSTKPNANEKPINVKREMNDAHKKWIVKDVPYIITKAERDAFFALKTDEERENFIAIFWQSRDPEPETEENEYREEYYERIAYANEHYASGIPGWKTDRGRIYITWGKPDSVESRPSGGTYDRPSYEGGGSTTTYPFETWFYRHLDGVGDGVEIEFVDRTGSGEYRIARDADEKDALATVPGLSRRAEREGNSYVREQDSPLSRILRIQALSVPPHVKFGDLEKIASTSTGTIDNNPLDFDVRVDYFRQSDNRVIVAFTVQTDNKELRFKGVGGLQTATLNIFGRVTSVSGKRSGIFEEAVTTNSTVADLAELRERKSVYQKSLALAPGNYKVDIVVRDVETGNRGIRSLGVEVPSYDEKKLSTSSLILASKLRSTNEGDIGQQFVIGNSKVIPNLSGVYKQGQEVGVYLQVYNAGIDQTTLRPAVDVEYILTKSGKEVMRQPEDWSGLSDSGQRLTLARLLQTSQLPLGEYEIKVVTKDRVGGQAIENKGKFTITQ
jgi:GWxTD domain-containing protein